MTAAIITACASAVVATLVFGLDQVAQSRRARLSRVNDQLRDLYGPLNTLLEVNERLWQVFRDAYLPAPDQRRPEAGSQEWRTWRDEVLMPVNRQMRDLIVQHADLLTATAMPGPMRDFCAHVSALEIVVIEESRGIHRKALVPHPGTALADHVQREFAELKHTQESLVRRKRSLRTGGQILTRHCP